MSDHRGLVGIAIDTAQKYLDERDAAVARAEVAEAALAEAAQARSDAWREGFRAGRGADHNPTWWPQNPYLTGDTPTEPTGDEPRPEDCERAAAEQLAARLTAAGRPVLADILLDWASKFAEPTGDESCTWQDEAACPVHAEPAAPTQDGDDPWAGIDRLDLLVDFEDGPR